MGDRLADSDGSLPEVDAAAQKTEFQAQISGLEATEKPACSTLMNAGASTGISGQAGERGSRPLSLALQQPAKDISQTASVDIQFPLSVGSSAVCGNPESSESKDLNVYPTSSSFPSGESEGAQHPEIGTKRLQVSLEAKAPLFQEKSSLSQGHAVPPFGTLAPSDPPPESPKEGVPESRRNEEEDAADLKAERRTDRSEDLVGSVLKEEGQVGSAGRRVNLQKVSEEPEASKRPRPTIVTDSRCSGASDRHRETAVLKAEAQKDGMEGPSHHLATAVPFEGGSPSMAQGGWRSNFLEDNIPYRLALENSLEGRSAVMTWPQDNDPFACGNTQEQAETTQGGVAEKRLASDVGQDLPEMYGPEMYEYFFADMEGAWMGESDGEKETGWETPSSSAQPLAPPPGSPDSDCIVAGDATHFSVPEVYEHFFNNGAQGRKSWKRLFLSGPASEAGKAVRALRSLLSKPAHLLRGRPPSPGTPLRRGSRGKLVVFSPRLREESPPRPGDLRMAVMSPERPLQLALTHRDMCLGFVAFASWAIKTSNLQAPDAWKIVLLANFGTLSAIRYFRRQITAEGESAAPKHVRGNPT